VSDYKIALLGPQEIPAAVQVLSQAMLTVPLHVAVFQGQGEKARRELERMFDALLRQYPGTVFLAKQDKRIVGVLRMKWCYGHPIAHHSAPGKTLKDTASRVEHWRNVWARHDPTQPHWHLGPVGVVPSLQGAGIGTMLMQRFCAVVDARESPAHLETDRLSSVRFYEKFGFRIIAEADIFDVRNRFMWRSPVSRPSGDGEGVCSDNGGTSHGEPARHNRQSAPKEEYP
jgi:ribosomal protein S18 acetylase RimI-like enzyme